jgi:hypothetical protein
MTFGLAEPWRSHEDVMALRERSGRVVLELVVVDIQAVPREADFAEVG